MAAKLTKEKEIMKFASSFLESLSELCLQACGKALTAIQFPVFKKFLAHRIKREIEFYNLCLNTASVLVETNTKLTADDLDEIIEESICLDKCFKRDILFMPVWIEFDYDSILPMRRQRAKLHVRLFERLLKTHESDYYCMVSKAFEKQEFLYLHNDILELYAEEAFLINRALKSFVEIDTEATAHRMHCSMLDIGFKLNRELAKKIFG